MQKKIIKNFILIFILTILASTAYFKYVEPSFANDYYFISKIEQEKLIDEIDKAILELKSGVEEKNNLNKYFINYKLEPIEKSIQSLKSLIKEEQENNLDFIEYKLEEKKWKWERWQLIVGLLAIAASLGGICWELNSQNTHKYNEWKSKLRQKIIEEVLKTDFQSKQEDRAKKIWTMFSDFKENDLKNFKPFFRQFNVNISEDKILDEQIRTAMSNLQKCQFNGTDNKKICKAINNLFRDKNLSIRAIRLPLSR